MNRLVHTQIKNAGRSEAASVWDMYAPRFAKCLIYSTLPPPPYALKFSYLTGNQVVDIETSLYPSLKEDTECRLLLRGLRLKF